MTKPMTKVEQVARALCWKNGMDPDCTLGGDGANYLWHEYVPAARAAIEKMRGPTPSMSKAGNSVEIDMGDHNAAIWLGADLAWEAMIDAALSEDGE